MFPFIVLLPFCFAAVIWLFMKVSTETPKAASLKRFNRISVALALGSAATVCVYLWRNMDDDTGWGPFIMMMWCGWSIGLVLLIASCLRVMIYRTRKSE